MGVIYERVLDDAAGPTSAPPSQRRRPPSSRRSSSSSSTSNSSSSRSSSASSCRKRCRSPRRRSPRATRLSPSPAQRPPPPQRQSAQPPKARRQRGRKYHIDLVKGIDLCALDLDRLQQEFECFATISEASSPAVRWKLTKIKFMERFDQDLHGDIRMYEQGNCVYPHEPLSTQPHKQAHKPSVPPPSRGPLARNRRAHLTPGPSGPPRSWSGAAGARPSQCRSRHGRPPRSHSTPRCRRSSKSRPRCGAPPHRRRLITSASAIEDVSELISPPCQRQRPAGSTSDQVLHAREVSNLLRRLTPRAPPPTPMLAPRTPVLALPNPREFRRRIGRLRRLRAAARIPWSAPPTAWGLRRPLPTPLTPS